MDRKTIIILAFCFVLIAATQILPNKIFKPIPAPPKPTNSLARATNAAATAGGTNAAAPGPVAELKPTVPAAASVTPSQPEQTLVVTNDSVRYTFSSHWGGLKQIELLQYPESVERGAKKDAAPRSAALNAQAKFPAMALLGGEALEGDGVFTLSQPSAGSVRAEKTLASGLVIAKDFSFGSNYQFKTAIRLENRGAQPLALPVQELVFGTATPMSAHDNGTLISFLHYDGVKAPHINEPWFANRTLGCFPGTPRSEYVSIGTNVVWAAVDNQFFAIIAQPVGGAPQIVGRRVDLPEPSAAAAAADSSVNKKPFGLQTAFVYPPTVLQPGQKAEHSFDVYAGPKEYQTLSRLNERKELVMNFSGFSGFFAKALLLSMNAINKTGLGYGWAIVVITVIIKILFWPLTQASTRSMKRMAKLQPQMTAIREKYKDDAAKMNQKIMEFMKENKVNPMGGCLPMLIQIPVFFGFYTMIQSAIELRGASFLWNSDLSQPDTLFIIPGLNMPFNLMPLLMGVTMLWQTRLTPPSPGVDPTQQKIMKYLPLMFLFMLYNFSAGLTLYWTVQNLLTIAQMKLTKSEPDAPKPALVAKPVAPSKKK